MTNNDSLLKLQERLKEMFQFQNNDLNFGIFKIFKLKQVEIEKFINNKLEEIVEEWLKNISNNEEKESLLEIELFLKGFQKSDLLQDIDWNYSKIISLIENFWNGETEKLKEILKSQRAGNIEWDLENKIYNYILNYFDLYYSNWDFGYNTRSLDSYKVEYDEDYNGSDVMFHWKHKWSYYIKTWNWFNSINFELDSKNLEFTLETNEESEDEEQAQNNNRDENLKHYKLSRIEKTLDNKFRVIFNLWKTSTTKKEVFKAIFKEVYWVDLDDEFILNKDWKPIFKDLWKDFDKTSDWNKKWFSQLRIKKDDLVKKYNSNFWRGEKLEAKTFDELNSKNITENTIIKLWSLDNKLNSFYIWNDSDYFIHQDLKWFLTREKEKFIKNNILWDLSTILNAKIDNTTLIIAKTFNHISDEIIEFLSVVEEFQKWIFEMKKKVLISEYCITLDKISEDFYEEIINNKQQIQEWQNLWFIEDEEINIDFLKNNKSLVIDTKLYTQTFKDNLLSTIENLEDQTNWLLINSENYQALNVLMNKYRGKIKCIYIDPPYNTWWDWFVYKDSFKHSSWLSMMENRLTLAKELLTEDWVIFVSIDDNEQDNLKKLMDWVFGNENIIAEIITTSNPWWRDYGWIALTHEYIYAYWKWKNSELNLLVQKDKKFQFKDELWDFDTREVRNRNIKFNDKNRPNLCYPFYVNEKNIDENWLYEISLDEKENYIKVMPLKSQWIQTVWRWWKPKSLENLNINLKWKIKADGTFMIVEKYRSNLKRVRSIFDEKEVRNEYWSLKLKWLFKKIDWFSYPKSIFLIKKLCELWSNKNDIILDFFSGSGTTQQAVIELNKEDKWNRKYIWVEMGEYFDSVTKPRVEKVIYSSNWKNWKPENNNWVSQIFKYQVLEQYEDILDKLENDWEEKPDWLDLKYLYRKEEVKLKSSLDLRKPFENNYVYWREKKETKIDLSETYNYLKWYNVESVKTYEFWDEKKYYKVVKTWNTLVIWRNIEVWENDIENIAKIVLKYSDIEEIEVNKEIYSLERDKFGRIEVWEKQIEVNIITESLFNE